MRGTDVPTTCPIALPPALGPIRSVAHHPASPTGWWRCTGLMQAYVLHDTAGPSPGTWPYNVEIPVGIAPDAMTRAEAGVTPLCQTLAFQSQDAHQTAVVLRDIDDVISVDIEKGRANQRGGPDLQQCAILVKNLDAIVLAVSHHHTAVFISPDAVR